MVQRSFLDIEQYTAKVVNVASVPQRSPFRYPGGKTWLVPYVRSWLLAQRQWPGEFIEPFAGGGIISLTVAAEKLADHVTMIELDTQVAAVWQTIFQDDGGAEWLADRIFAFEVTATNVRAVLAQSASTTRERAFQTILKNRCNRGGILANGAGLIKEGEAHKGLGSRWYPETLRKRILDLVPLREKITFINADALPMLAQQAHRSDAVYFIDPPYTAAGKRAGTRLYNHFALDHERLFQVAATFAGDFLMTYDNAPEICEMARQYGFATQTVAMKNTHHETMRELLIGRDLAWLGELVQ